MRLVSMAKNFYSTQNGGMFCSIWMILQPRICCSNLADALVRALTSTKLVDQPNI